MEPFSGTVHRSMVYGSWVLDERYVCECGGYSISVYVFEEWFEYKLLREFKASNKVINLWINRRGDIVIVIVEESFKELCEKSSI